MRSIQVLLMLFLITVTARSLIPGPSFVVVVEAQPIPRIATIELFRTSLDILRNAKSVCSFVPGGCSVQAVRTLLDQATALLTSSQGSHEEKELKALQKEMQALLDRWGDPELPDRNGQCMIHTIQVPSLQLIGDRGLLVEAYKKDSTGNSTILLNDVNEVKEAFRVEDSFIVSFIGAFSTGKTYIFNLMSGCRALSSFEKFATTQGWSCSFDLPAVDDMRAPMCYIDIQGTGRPVDCNSSGMYRDRAVTDNVVVNGAVNVADVVIFVVNALSNDVQIKIKQVARQVAQRGLMAASSGGHKPELWVFHNLVHVWNDDRVLLNESIQSDIIDAFGAKRIGKNADDLQFSSRPVPELPEFQVRHWVMVNAKSPLGKQVNDKTIKSARRVLQGKGINDRQTNVYDALIKYLHQTLHEYFYHMPPTDLKSGLGGQDGERVVPPENGGAQYWAALGNFIKHAAKEAADQVKKVLNVQEKRSETTTASGPPANSPPDQIPAAKSSNPFKIKLDKCRYNKSQICLQLVNKTALEYLPTEPGAGKPEFNPLVVWDEFLTASKYQLVIYAAGCNSTKANMSVIPPGNDDGAVSFVSLAVSCTNEEPSFYEDASKYVGKDVNGQHCARVFPGHNGGLGASLELQQKMIDFAKNKHAEAPLCPTVWISNSGYRPGRWTILRPLHSLVKVDTLKINPTRSSFGSFVVEADLITAPNLPLAPNMIVRVQLPPVVKSLDVVEDMKLSVDEEGIPVGLEAEEEPRQDNKVTLSI